MHFTKLSNSCSFEIQNMLCGSVLLYINGYISACNIRFRAKNNTHAHRMLSRTNVKMYFDLYASTKCLQTS